MADTETLPHSAGPAGGWGSLKGIVQIFGEAWSSPGAVRAEACQLLSVRVLRERGESHPVGADECSMHACFLAGRGPYGERIAKLEGSRS
jgi:hypothetical protein